MLKLIRLWVCCISFLFVATNGCGPVENEFSIDEPTYPPVTRFEVADSSFRGNIHLSITANIGETTAYTFDRIATGQRDTLFAVAVLGRHKESSSGTYEPRLLVLDTIIVLQSPKLGMHYFELHPRNGGLVDSTFVY